MKALKALPQIGAETVSPAALAPVAWPWLLACSPTATKAPRRAEKMVLKQRLFMADVCGYRDKKPLSKRLRDGCHPHAQPKGVKASQRRQNHHLLILTYCNAIESIHTNLML
jgi:hypothetical protein